MFSLLPTAQKSGQKFLHASPRTLVTSFGAKYLVGAEAAV